MINWTGKEDGISAAQPTLGPEALGLQDRQRGRRRAGLGGPGGPGGPRRPRRAPEGPGGPGRHHPSGPEVARRRRPCASRQNVCGGVRRAQRARLPPLLFFSEKTTQISEKSIEINFHRVVERSRAYPEGLDRMEAGNACGGDTTRPWYRVEDSRNKKTTRSPKLAPKQEILLEQGPEDGGGAQYPPPMAYPSENKRP